MNLTHVLFSPNGRISPQEYWIGLLIIIGSNLFLTWLPVLGAIIWLGLIYVGFCVYGKRLHDAGKSAWIHALVWLIQFVLGAIVVAISGGALISAIMASNEGAQPDVAAILGASGGVVLFGGLGFLLWIVYTIWVGITAGEPGTNRFGPPPGTVTAPTADAAATPAAAPATAAQPAPPAAEPAADPGVTDGPPDPPEDKA